MRHVRPLLLVAEDPLIQAVMQFTEPVATVSHTNEYRGRNRHKRFHLAQDNFKWIHVAAQLRQVVHRLSLGHFRGEIFGTNNLAWRENGHMGRKERKVGMHFAPKILDKLS